MLLRLFDFEIHNACDNMAIDQKISDEVINGKPPALRFYGWASPSVTLGYFQKESAINTDYCREFSIPIVKRPTGGRAVLHGDELTYSFVSEANNGIFTDNLLNNYHILSSVFKEAFKEIGLDVMGSNNRKNHSSKSPLCFDSPSFGEITVKGKKIIGSAQRRYKGGYFLQQGSIPFTINRELMAKVFNINNSLKSMAGINEFAPDITKSNLIDAILKAFLQILKAEFVRAPSPIIKRS